MVDRSLSTDVHKHVHFYIFAEISMCKRAASVTHQTHRQTHVRVQLSNCLSVPHNKVTRVTMTHKPLHFCLMSCQSTADSFTSGSKVLLSNSNLPLLDFFCLSFFLNLISLFLSLPSQPRFSPSPPPSLGFIWKNIPGVLLGSSETWCLFSVP